MFVVRDSNFKGGALRDDRTVGRYSVLDRRAIQPSLPQSPSVIFFMMNDQNLSDEKYNARKYKKMSQTAQDLNCIQ